MEDVLTACGYAHTNAATAPCKRCTDMEDKWKDTYFDLGLAAIMMFGKSDTSARQTLSLSPLKGYDNTDVEFCRWIF